MNVGKSTKTEKCCSYLKVRQEIKSEILFKTLSSGSQSSLILCPVSVKLEEGRGELRLRAR